MIFKDALRSLKNNLSRAFFYWLTFVLTSAFIFLFFNISMSEEIGVTWFYSKDDMATTVTIFVVLICSIDIFFANDFFVKNKAKDLAVRLVSGATYMQLASYLLVQTFLLLAIAVPAGVLLALTAIPFMNMWLASMSLAFTISVHFDAVIVTVIVLLFVIFWTTILNLSFAYRNAASMMLNSGTMLKLNGGSFIKKKNTMTKFKKIMSIVLYFAPLVLFWLNPGMIAILSVLGMVGLNMMIKQVIIPLSYRMIDEKKTDKPLLVACGGFLRSDLQSMKLNLMLHIVCVVILISLLVNASQGGLEMMLVMLSYVVLNILQAMCLMFRFSTETVVRRRFYKTLAHIGFLPEELVRIVRNEVFSYFGFCLAAALLYLLDIFAVLGKEGVPLASNAPALLAIFVVPMVFCAFMSFRYYLKVVQPAWVTKAETID